MTSVSASDILKLRLQTQRIAPRHPGGPADVVRHLLAVQAQDFAQALWAVALRATGCTRDEVLAAFDSGEIVRTLPMRGTLHFIPPEDLRWMLELTSARTLQSATTRFRNLGLDPATLERAEQIVARELAQSGRLSRDEFMKLLGANGVAPDGQRGYHVIFYLAQIALVCWGPTAGTQQALVLVDDWIPSSRRLDRAAALHEFALRYFTGHGPATERDFAWWTKLTLTDARAGIASATDQLTELEHGGTRYLVATSELDNASTADPQRTVHALPGFDEYLIAYQDRSLPLDAEHFERIVPGSNGIFLPIVVNRGHIVGTWRRVPKSKTSEIVPDHFLAASAALSKGFAREAQRYAAFTESRKSL